MKIFTADQMRAWDAYTILHEPISSLALMERAASACCKWLLQNNFQQKHFRIFCGKGNNGGDGLALARMLILNHCEVTIYIIELGNIGSADFQANLEKLHQYTADLHFIQSPQFFPIIEDGDLIIDALFGTGLNKPVTGINADLISFLNQQQAPVVAIDLPSGLYADKSSKGNPVIAATTTLSFHHYKLAFLLPENECHCGNIIILDIGLHKGFERETTSAFELSDFEMIRSIYKRRSKFANKGSFGHSALITGSLGMMGAAVLASRACLHSGTGKLTCYIPKSGYEIMQIGVPEAICRVAGENNVLSTDDISNYDAVGIGPGLGTAPANIPLFKTLLSQVTLPLVIDADALNMIAMQQDLLKLIPPGSILTPHPKEFERLFGPVNDDFERLQLALLKSKEFNIYIIVKGHFTFIASPAGPGYFNCTGNAGMAKAGSGDVLTGIITALLAQHYSPQQASLLGTYLHGSSGDIAAIQFSQEAMTASDIVNCLSLAFKQIAVSTPDLQ